MEEQKMIYGALVKVMRSVGAIGKNSKNQQQGFSFRGIDDVMNAMHKPFSEAGLVCIPEVLERVEDERTNSRGTTLFWVKLKVKYTFYAEDGSSISSIVIGEAMDSGDKGTSKAMSMSYKTMIFQVFNIPVEEQNDPDFTTHEVAPKQAKSTAPAKTKEEVKSEPNKTFTSTDSKPKKELTLGSNDYKKCVDWLVKYPNGKIETLTNGYHISDMVKERLEADRQFLLELHR